MYHKKKNLLDLQRTRAGTYRDINSGIFLDRNERAVPYDNKINRLLSKYLEKINLNLYPEMDPFYIKLSNWLKVNKDEIYITEGVSGAIKGLIETLTLPGENNIVFPYPTFALYPVYCKMFDVKFKFINYKQNYALDFEQLIGAVDKNTSIVFLPNPNTPIEGTIGIDKIKTLANHCNKKNVMLVLDEVYYPFGDITGIELIKEFDNVLIMRSFSKAFGLAGIRLGYLIGNSENISYVSKTRTGYESNSVSMSIASFYIDRYDIVLDYVQQVKEGLEFLKHKLNAIEIEYNGGDSGNSIYLNLKDAFLAKNIVESLITKNIYVRGNWPAPFNRGFSVTGAPINIMKIFYNEFQTILLEEKGKK